MDKRHVAQHVCWMHTNPAAFNHFVQSHLNSTAFETRFDEESTKLFHISLQSAYVQFDWTKTCTNLAGSPFKYEAGFINDYSPNALADRNGDTYYLCMHMSLFTSINEFCMFCFAQKDFFPELGEAENETSPEPLDGQVPGLWLINHTLKGRHVTEAQSRHLIPKNPHRFEMSQKLAFLMARFVWLHELAHCFNGHIDFARQQKLALRLYEVPPALPAVQMQSRSATTDADALQCLEFDADQSAIWANCNIQLEQLENIEWIKSHDQDLRIRLTLFGSYAMTWLFEQYQIYAATHNNTSHPAPLERLQFLFETTQEKLLAQQPELVGLNDDAIGQFDSIRRRVPQFYESEQLRSLFAKSSTNARHKLLAEKRVQVLEKLRPFQFTAKTNNDTNI